MDIGYGRGITAYGPGIEIRLSGDEVALAIDAYLVAHDVVVRGPRTITVNGALCGIGRVYVDPSGFVISEGEKLDGRGPDLTLYERRAVDLKQWLLQQDALTAEGWVLVIPYEQQPGEPPIYMMRRRKAEPST